MLKNKIAFKRIRNVIFLGLIILVMLGIYNNVIRSSRAENTELIDIDFVDVVTEGGLATFRLENVSSTKNVETVNEVETVTSYTIPLTNIVNGKAVTKYKGPDNTEVAAINGGVLTVPAENVKIDETTGAGVEITVTYDQQVVTAGVQTVTIYNQTLNDSPVTVSGYVPNNTTLEVNEVESSSLTAVTIPTGEKIEEAYDITLGGYQPENFAKTVDVAIYTELTETPKVYHVASDGITLENMNATLEGKNIKFTADKFSTYIVTTEGEQTEPDDTTNPDNENTTPDNTVTPEVTTPEKVTTELLKNGDRFKVSGVTYEITDAENKKVKIVSVDASVTDLTIPETVQPNLTTVTNDNIGEYIDLGNNVVGTNSTLDDWRILYKENSTIYAVLADYLPASKVPTAANLNTDITNYPYGVWSNTDRKTLIDGLLNESAWSGFANGINGVRVIGTPTKELIVKSYNEMDGATDITLEGVQTLDSNQKHFDLYVPHRETVEDCYGYWLANEETSDEELVWWIHLSGDVGYYHYYQNIVGVRPVVALPEELTAVATTDGWKIGVAGVDVDSYTVTSIESNAFANSTGLTNLTISKNITSLTGNMFDTCSALNAISVDANNASYSAESGVLFNKNKTEIIKYPVAKSGEYTIPNTVTTIGESAFANAKVTKVKIPTSVETIKTKAFVGCTSLAELTVLDTVTTIEETAFASTTKLNVKENSTAHEYAVDNSQNYQLMTAPKWTKVSGTVGENGTVTFVLNGKSDYGAKVTSSLKDSDITVLVDGQAATGVTVTVGEATENGNEITQTVTITNLNQTEKQAGKDYLEWSGYVVLDIASGSLTDEYGFTSSLGTTDESIVEGTTTFIDQIKPEINYLKANSGIAQDTATLVLEFEVVDKYFSETKSNILKAKNSETSNIKLRVNGQEVPMTSFEITKKSPKTDLVNNVSKDVGATYQVVATDLDDLTTSGTVDLVFPTGAVKDTSENGSEPQTITAAVNQSNEQIVVDFIQPIWEQIGTVSAPENVDDRVEISIIGSDKYLESCDLKEDGTGIEVLVDGQKVEATEIKRSVELVAETNDTDPKTKTYKITLSDFQNVSGYLKVNVLANTLIDIAENKNDALEINVGDVDFVQPVWSEPTEDVVDENKTIEIHLTGTDQYLIESLTDENKDAIASNIQVFLDGETEPNTSVTKTIKDIVYEPADGTVKNKVTATVVLGNFGNYIGKAKIIIPKETEILKDVSGLVAEDLEYTTKVDADFKKPEWKEATSEVKKDTQTVEIALEGIDDFLTETITEENKATIASSIQVFVGNETTANTTITKTLKNIEYTPSGEGETRTNVKATLELGNFENNSGTMKIVIPAAVLVDESGNLSNPFEYTTEIVDFVKPVITDLVETKVNADTMKYTFNLTEKHIDDSEDISTDSEIIIKVDGTDVTSQLTKNLEYTKAEGSDVRNYTLTLSGFKAKDLSGYVSVEIKDNAVTDQYENTSSGASITGTILVDSILPVYKYNYAGATVTGQDGTAELTVVFSAEDKHLDKELSTLGKTSSVQVAIDNEIVPQDQVTLTVKDDTQNGKVEYLLNVKLLKANTDKGYAEFSGYVDITIPDGVVVDKNGNAALGTSFTLKDVSQSDILVDALKPEWKEPVITYPTTKDGALEITFVGTDRFLDYNNSQLKLVDDTTATGTPIEIYLGDVQLIDNSILKRTLTRNEDIKTTDGTISYGISYTLRIEPKDSSSGFDINTGKIKVVIPEGALKDQKPTTPNVSDAKTVETNLIDFKAPTWTATVTTPVTTATAEITLEGTDEFLDKENSKLEEGQVQVLLDNSTEHSITKNLTKVEIADSNKVKYVLTLGNLDKVSGEVKVTIPGGTLKDTANPANESIAKDINLGLVDQIKPEWKEPVITYPTTKDGDLTITFVGTDRSLDYTNSALSLTGDSPIAIYFGNTQIIDDSILTRTLERTENKPYEVSYTLTLKATNGFDVNTGKVKVEIPAGALKDQSTPTANGSESLTVETNLIDFKAPVWDVAVTTPVTTATTEITLVGIDEFIDKENSKLEDGDIQVLLDGTDTHPITKSIAKQDIADTDKVKYVLTLGELDKVSGEVKVIIPAGILKDQANPVNQSAEKTIDLGIVDQVKPIWNPVTNLVNSDGTVSFTISGYDKYLDQTAVENALKAENIILDLEGDAEETTTIKKTIDEINIVDGNVTAKVTLTDFGTYSGNVIVKLPAGTLKDTSTPVNSCDGLTYEIELVDFIKPVVGNFVETEVNKDTVNYTFDVIEKYIPEGETVDLSELVIKVDDIDVTDKITKVITPEKATSGTTTYTLTLSGFKALNVSGNVYVEVKANAIIDKAGNPSDKASITGTLMVDDLVPEFTYKYASTSNPTINPTDDSFVVIFEIKDRYLTGSALTLRTGNEATDLIVKIDGTEITAADSGFAAEDITLTTQDFTEKDENGKDLVGIRYFLTVQNLAKVNNGKYDEYSGPVQLAIPANVATDQKGNSSAGKTITVDKGTGDGGDDTLIIDVIEPKWDENLAGETVINRTQAGVTTGYEDTVDITIRGTDKYINYDTSAAYDPNNIVVLVNDTPISSITKTWVSHEKVLDGEKTYGIKHVLRLGNFGEHNGTVKIQIPEGAIVDQSGLKSAPKEYLIGTVDFVKPEVTVNSVTYNYDAQGVQTGIVYTFTITDNDFLSSVLTKDLVITDDEVIEVKVDNENASSVTRTITNVEAIEKGQRYTLELTGFEEATRNGSKMFKEWSGNVSITIGQALVKDKSGNGNATKTVNNIFENSTETATPVYIDNIKPEVTYSSSTDVIDKTARTVTVKFDITDKHFAGSMFQKGDVIGTKELDGRVKVFLFDDNENNAIEITDNVTKTITDVVDINYNGTKVGETYTLQISDIKQENVSEDYRDFSGRIQIILGEVPDTATEKRLAWDTTTPANSIDKKIFVIGKENEDGEGTIIDVVEPEWRNVPETDIAINNGATNKDGNVVIKFKGTDKYFKNSTLTQANVDKIVTKVDGTTVNLTKVLDGPTDLENGNGVEYTLTLSNFGDNSGKLVVTLPAGVLFDDNGLTNFEKDITVERVDFIDPTWEVKTEGTTYSSIDRTNKIVTFKIKGYDKFLDKDYSDISKRLDSDNKLDYLVIRKNGEPVDDAEKASLVKSITNLGSLDNTALEYEIQLHNFGNYEGEISIDVVAETLEDQSGNRNTIFENKKIGNANWVEANDDTGNKYPAFRNSIVDFTKPTITYQYSNVNNPIIDKEDQTLTIVFDVNDSYINEDPISDNLSSIPNLKEKIRIRTDMNTELTQILLDNVDTKITKISDTSSGRRYELVLSGFEQSTWETYKNYSGPIQLIFEEDLISDTSGNKSAETTITIDKGTGNDESNPIIVDVIKPVWENATSINITPSDSNKEDKAGTVEITFRGTDKYLSYEESYLEIAELLSQMKVYEVAADGTEKLNTTISKDLEKIRDLDEDRTNLDGTVTNGVIYGVEYKLTLSNFGDYSGKIRVKIAGGTLIDTSDLVSDEKVYEVPYVDFIKPKINPVSASVTNTDEMKIVFTATDKHFDYTNTNLLPADIQVYVDDEPAGNITKTLTKENFTAENGDVGYKYTLTLTNFRETTRQDGKKYKEWSGTVKIDIAKDKILDMAGNKNEAVLKMSDTFTGNFIDNIAPEFTYRYSDGDISQVNKNLKVAFEITDNYFKESTLTTDNIQINVYDNNGYRKENVGVTKGLTETGDVYDEDGTTVIGKAYELTLTNFDQDNGFDFSGLVDVVFKSSGTPIAEDTSGNSITGHTLTIGVDDPTGDNDEAVIVDLVDPVWEKVTSQTTFDDALNGTSVITVKGSDKYLSFAGEHITDLKPEHVKVYVDNEETAIVSTVSAQMNKTTTSVEYQITVTGFTADNNQVRIEILPGALKDASGNTNKKSSRFIAFNTLSTSTADSFLGIEGLNRNNITSLKFVVDKNAKFQSGTNVAAQGDVSIWAVVSGTEVTIYSADEIHANKNSSYLFANINAQIQGIDYINTNNVTNMSHMFEGYGKNVSSLTLGNNLDTSHVTNMSYMFKDCGTSSLSSFTLKGLFNTSKVTDMSYMFAGMGTNSLTNFTLSDGFNTSNVTNMSHMFESFGTNSLTKLDLGNNFYTNQVTDMSYMFAELGTQKLTTLDFGDHFDTTTVTNMSYMFENCGKNSMTTLDLNAPGIDFDTTNVTDMTAMFKGCGFEKMTELDLGPAFIRIANNHSDFITDCGKNGNVIQVAQLIYNDTYHLKINKEVERVENAPENNSYIAYERGTINPKYSPFWAKEDSSSAVTVTEDQVVVNFIGTDEYDGYKESHLTQDMITVVIDGEVVDNIGISLSEGTEGTFKAVGTDEATRGIKYTVTLTNFEQGRLGENKPEGRTLDLNEWSGNIQLKIDEGALEDTFGNYNFDNFVEEKDTDGETQKVYEEEAANRMFKDNILPEITYRFADTTIDQVNKVVTVYFDITDKYVVKNINDEIELDVSKLGLIVEDDVVSSTSRFTLTKASDIYENINGKQKKVGERYKLEIKNLEEELKDKDADFNNYSGPITVTFQNGMVVDTSGNASNGEAMTFTIGVDNPGGNPEDEVTVDFVRPVWEYVESSITRTRNGDSKNEVKLQIKGSDKYLDHDASNLTKDDITVFIDGIEATLKADGTPRLEVKEPELIGSDKYSETYEITLTNFKSDFTDYGKITLKIKEGTLKDLADTFVTGHNKNESDYTYFDVGNKDWTEKVDGVDTPEYKAFNNSIVDFEKPIIKYKYSEFNPSVNYENDRVTVVFEVLEKDFYTDGLTMKPNGATLSNTEIKENLRIIVDGKDISDQVFNSVDTTLTAVNFDYSKDEDDTNNDVGKRYTLVIDGLEKALAEGEEYRDYSGPIQLSFKKGIVADNSGNKSDSTLINLDLNDGSGSTDSLIIDVVNPVWENINASIDENGNGTGHISFTRKRDGDANDSVSVEFRGTDKYLDKSTIEEDLLDFQNGIQILNEAGTNVTDKFEKVLQIVNTDNDYEVKYKLTLTSEASKYLEEYSGVLKVVVPKEQIKDSASECNEVLNAIEDKVYTIPLVDFVKPTWEKQIGEFSKINRVRDGKASDTVEIKLIATDKHMDKDRMTLLDNDDIVLYFDGEELTRDQINNVIESIKLVESNTNPETIEYIVTLHNFDDFSGYVGLEIINDDLVTDAQGNKGKLLTGTHGKENEYTGVGVGNENWVEQGDNAANPKYKAFRENIVDFTYPDLVYVDSELNYDDETLTVEIKASDKFLSESSVNTDKLTVVFNKGDAIYEVSATTENIDIDLIETDDSKYETDGEISYKFKISNLDLGQILEGEQYAHYSGPISFVFEEGIITDTSGNRNPEKTITVQQDGDENSNLVVDVVDPLWTMENLEINRTDKTVTLDICGTDKYFSKTTLELENIEIYLDGVINTELTREFLTDWVPINLDGTTDQIGVRRTIKISGFERVEKLEGKAYRDWSGHLDLVIPAGTLEDYTENKDASGNTVGHVNVNQKTTLKVRQIDNVPGTAKVDVVDFLKPEVEWISADMAVDANNRPTTLTYVFEITDKNFKESKLKAGKNVAANNNYIEVFINGESTNGKGITRTLSVTPITENVMPGVDQAAVSQRVGERYTLVLSNFDAGILKDAEGNDKAFVEWAGNVDIKLNDNIVEDTSGNTSDGIGALPTDKLKYIDNIKPQYIYKYHKTATAEYDADIDRTNKTVTMIFDITDKYFVSDLLNELTTAAPGSTSYTLSNGMVVNAEISDDGWVTLNDSSLIKVDVDNDEAADADLVKKLIKVKDIEATVEGANVKVGERYKLVIGNIEQLDIKEGDKYKEYSGPMHISFTAEIAQDKGNTYSDGTTVVNKSDATTITIGVNEPDGEGEEVIVDFIKPVWEKVDESLTFTTSASGDVTTQATLTLRGVDKYISGVANNLKDHVTIFEGENDITDDVTISVTSPSNIYENREQLDGTLKSFVYAKQVKFTISGFDLDTKQITLQVHANTLYDTSNNYSDISDKYIIYNTLKATNNEKNADSNFLGIGIPRESITKVEFTGGKIPSDAFDESGNVTAGYYDVSAAGDKTIIAKKVGTEIYISSDNKIYANPDASYLFANVGANANSFSINGIEYMNTKNVTNMKSMFENCGNKAMTVLDLNSNFYTTNVTDMSSMFKNCGYTAMTLMNLGTRFDTSNVTTMESMFENCGNKSLTQLSLANVNFTSTKVSNMNNMFNGCGQESMTLLELNKAFVKIPGDRSTDFIKNCGKASVNETVIRAAEAIFNDEHNFKLNAGIERVENPSSSNYISYRRGKINPEYIMEWKKESVSYADNGNKMLITIVGVDHVDE